MRSSSSTVRIRVPTPPSCPIRTRSGVHEPAVFSPAAPARRAASRNGSCSAGEQARTEPACTGPPSRSADGGAGLAGDDLAGRQVPGGQPGLVVDVEPRAGDEAEVRGRGAEPPDVPHAGEEGRQHHALLGPSPRLVGEARADQGGLQVGLVAAAQRLAVTMGAVAAGRAEQLTEAGDGDRARRPGRRRPPRRWRRPSRAARRGSWSCRRWGR